MMASMPAKRFKLGVACGGLLGLAIAGTLLYWVGGRGRADLTGSDGGRHHEPALEELPEVAGDGLGARIRVTGTVRELLTHAAVAGVEVLYRSGDVDSGTTSGADGGYAIEVAAGRYWVNVAGSELVGLDGMWLAVAAGSAPGAVDIAVISLARIDGVVVDASGDPLAGVVVKHRTELAARTFTSADTNPTGGTTSDDLGRFSISVAPGTVELVATAVGQPDSATTLRGVDPGVTVRGVEIVMAPGVMLSGSVRDHDGAPVAGARVGLRGELRELLERDTISDDAGRFSFVDLRPGRMWLAATAPGHGASPELGVDLGDGDRQATVELLVSPPQELSGRVVDGHGAAIVGAIVGAGDLDQPLLVRKTSSDGAGEFVIAGLGHGPYDVYARAEGFALSRRANITLPCGELELVIAASGAIAGMVSSARGVVGEFTVEVARYFGAQAPPQVTRLRFASTDGGYRVSGLSAGSYRLVVAAPGFAPVEVVAVEVTSAETSTVAVELRPGSSLEGRLVDAVSGAPIVGAVVLLSPGHEAGHAYSDAAGQFVIDDIAPGRRSVDVRHPAYARHVESSELLVAGVGGSMTIRLRPLSSAAGAEGESAGIGVGILVAADSFLIAEVVAHTPAAVAGMQINDQIVSIAGETTRGRSLADVSEAMRGIVGTSVELGLRRGEEELELRVVRGQVGLTP